MWLPLTQICATPSQPFWPYVPLQTSTRPLVGLHLPLACPATIVVSSIVDWLQSLEVLPRYGFQLDDRLSPNLTLNGLLVRAQWYPFQEWLAPTENGDAARAARTMTTTNASFPDFVSI